MDFPGKLLILTGVKHVQQSFSVGHRCTAYKSTFCARNPLSLISILTHVDLVTRRVFFMVSEVQIIIFQLFMEDTVVGVKSTTYSGLITSGFFRTNNNNNKRIF